MKKISLPKIGIRPVIDGRHMGARESLEEQTVNMAKATAALLTEKLRHACGAAVECVISDTHITGMAEVAVCEEKFSNQNVGLTITTTPCWCYGSKIIDMNPTRLKTIRGFNGTERPDAVYLAAAPAAHNQKGIPAFSIYGHNVQNTDDTSVPANVEGELLRFIRAGLAVASMKGESYLSLGGVSMGIAGSTVDHNFFESWLGMKIQAMDITELRRRIDQEIYDGARLEMALAWADKNFRYSRGEGNKQYQRNAEQSHAVLRESLLMAMCVRDMMQGNSKLADIDRVEESLGYNTIATGFQEQRRWIDQYPSGDTTKAVLNSSFGWNDICEPFAVATENDSLSGVVMLVGHQLTGTAQVFTDVCTHWLPGTTERVAGHELGGLAEHGVVHLINSGSATLDGSYKQRDSEGNPTMKPYWEAPQQEADVCLAATEWCPVIHGYFRGDGYSSHFLTEGGVPFIMTRVNIIKGLGSVLQIVEGWNVELPRDVHDILSKRTSPAWPTTWFASHLTGKGPFTDVYSVMANWDASHGILTIGHVGAGFIALTPMLHVPVCMHNIEETKAYHPSARAAHDMDIEGQDYRACQNYDPLCKRQYITP